MYLTSTLEQEKTSELEASPDSARRLSGRTTAGALLDQLLNFPMESRYALSMQEAKYHPLDTKGYHCLHLEGSPTVLWRSDAESRTSSAAPTRWQNENSYSLQKAAPGEQSSRLPEVGTIRSLIHSLSAIEPGSLLDLTGNFQDGLKIRVYPGARSVLAYSQALEKSDYELELTLEDSDAAIARAQIDERRVPAWIRWIFRDRTR